jgi:hypothetical protein
MSIPPIKKVAASTLLILRSKKFFYGIVALLIIQAMWMALTARYPMAFDENFHFGIIQIYSHQWSPFIASTPPDSGAYGELTRTPSYFYHYLMSFPYRLVALFTDQQVIQVVALRFINIAFFAGGLVTFYRLLSRLKFSAGAINLSLLMIVLIPVVPFLAGQINYDNLLFLIIPLTALLALSCGETLSKKGLLPATKLVLLFSLGMVGSITKYAYLPILFAVLVYLSVLLVRHKKYQGVFTKTWGSFKALRPKLQIALVVLFVIAGGLFIERYGVNVVAYGSPEPDCAKVESVSHCMQYGPWERNYSIKTNNEAAGNTSLPNQFTFLPEWVAGMMHRLYFAINYDYVNYYELPLPILTASIVGAIGLILVVIYWRTLFSNNPHLWLIVTLVAVYLAALLYVNYSDYLRYKMLLAVNGRYLILILPFVFAFIATAYSLAFKKIALKKQATAKFALAIGVIALTLQGGGILTFAVRSDDNWYWENSLARSLGRGLKDSATPFIIGANHKDKA